MLVVPFLMFCAAAMIAAVAVPILASRARQGKPGAWRRGSETRYPIIFATIDESWCVLPCRSRTKHVQPDAKA
jgi:hypothetical protein